MSEQPEQWWCVDCGCSLEYHALDSCGRCDDCFHPHMQRVIPPTANEGKP
jgi:hypothetical protein